MSLKYEPSSEPLHMVCSPIPAGLHTRSTPQPPITEELLTSFCRWSLGPCKEAGVCVRKTEILVEQHPPQGIFVCDHAGLVINKFSLWALRSTTPHGPTKSVDLQSRNS